MIFYKEENCVNYHSNSELVEIYRTDFEKNGSHT